MDYTKTAKRNWKKPSQYQKRVNRSKHHSTFRALSEAVPTHPQRFRNFNFLQQPVRYPRAESLKAEQPLILSFSRSGQPRAMAYRDRSVRRKLLLRSNSRSSWQWLVISSTASSWSWGTSCRRIRDCSFVNLGARERTRLFMFLLHLRKHKPPFQRKVLQRNRKTLYNAITHLIYAIAEWKVKIESPNFRMYSYQNRVLCFLKHVSNYQTVHLTWFILNSLQIMKLAFNWWSKAYIKYREIWNRVNI